MSKKFEKLIEYVINDEEQKARDLFHEIVVEKSREIYENLMHEEDMDEMGNPAGQLITDIEVDEEGMTEEEDEVDFADEIGGDMDADAGDMDMDAMDMDADAGDMDMDAMDMDADAGDIEDKVLDIDAKLDELLAKFEEVIGGEEADDMDSDDDFDTDEESDEEEEEVAEGEYSEEDEEEVMEAVALQKVSVDHGERLAGANGGGDKLGVNKKSPNAENSGKGVTGSIAQPVKTKGADTNPDGTSAPSSAKPADAIKGLQNEAGKSMAAQKAAVKPSLGQASGVNTKSPVKGIK